MRFLGKLLLWTAVFMMLVLFFLPKKPFYYEAEQRLNKEHVILSGERADDTGFGLTLHGGTLYFEDLKVAELEKMTVSPWLLYNRISIAPFSLSPAMKSFLPERLDGITVTYSVLDPFHVVLEASGAFGTLEGSIGLKERKIIMELSPSKQLRTLKPFWLKEFRQTKEGGYRYESSY